jgi:hypothetical protein
MFLIFQLLHEWESLISQLLHGHLRLVVKEVMVTLEGASLKRTERRTKLQDQIDKISEKLLAINDNKTLDKLWKEETPEFQAIHPDIQGYHKFLIEREKTLIAERDKIKINFNFNLDDYKFVLPSMDNFMFNFVEREERNTCVNIVKELINEESNFERTAFKPPMIIGLMGSGKTRLGLEICKTVMNDFKQQKKPKVVVSIMVTITDASKYEGKNLDRILMSALLKNGVPEKIPYIEESEVLKKILVLMFFYSKWMNSRTHLT